MRSRAVSIAVNVAVLVVAFSSLVYTLVHGYGRWTVPIYAMGAGACVISGYRELLQRKRGEAVLSISLALMFSLFAVDVLGIVIEGMWIFSAVIGTAGIAYFLLFRHRSQQDVR